MIAHVGGHAKPRSVAHSGEGITAAVRGMDPHIQGVGLDLG